MQEIRIYDLTTKARLVDIDNYTSLMFARSWNGVGTFTLEINKNVLSATKLAALAVDNILMVGDSSKKVGIITEVENLFDQTGRDSEIINVQGMELKGILEWRFVEPNPLFDRYVLNDNVETVMKTLVTDQVVNAINAKRNMPITVDADGNAGDPYLLSVDRSSIVSKELESASLATGAGWYIYFTGSAYKFQVAFGVDRTAGQSVNGRAIFSSDFETLKQGSYKKSYIDYKTYLSIGGTGVGKNRISRNIYSGLEPESFSRKECFIDARELATNADLDAKGAAELEKKSALYYVEGQPMPVSPLVYGTDYELGDLVTVKTNEGIELDTRITEVQESWAVNAYEISLQYDKSYPEFNKQMANQGVATTNILNANESDPQMPPTNNVTNLAFTEAANADSSHNVKLTWDYTQGIYRADGFLVFIKAGISAPGAIDINKDVCDFVRATETPVGEYEFRNLPSLQQNSGTLPIHYRFGVIAVGFRRNCTAVHAAGVVEVAGWIDKTFAGTIQFDAENYWNLLTGEFKVGWTTRYIHIDPAEETFDIYGLLLRLTNSSLLTYEGSGDSRYSLSREGLADVWRLDAADGDPITEVARTEYDTTIGAVLRTGIQKSVCLQIDGATAATEIEAITSNYNTTCDLANGFILQCFCDASYHPQWRLYDIAAGTWGADAEIEAVAEGFFLAVCNLGNGKAMLISSDASGYLYYRLYTITTDTWDSAGAATLIENANGFDGSALCVLGNGTVLHVASASDHHPRWRLYTIATDTWGAATEIAAVTTGYYPALCKATDDTVMCTTQDSAAYPYQRIFTISSSTWEGAALQIEAAANGGSPALLKYNNDKMLYVACNSTYNRPRYRIYNIPDNTWSGAAEIDTTDGGLYNALVDLLNGNILHVSSDSSDGHPRYRLYPIYAQEGGGIIESFQGATDGFVKYSDGRMEQWGWGYIVGNGLGTLTATVTLPIPWENENYYCSVNFAGMKLVASGAPTVPHGPVEDYCWGSCAGTATPLATIKIMLYRLAATSSSYNYIYNWEAHGR